MQHLELPHDPLGSEGLGRPHTSTALPCTYSSSRRLGLSRFHTCPTLSLLPPTPYNAICWSLYCTRGNFPYRDSNPAPRRQGATSPHDHFNPRVFTAAEPALSPMTSPGLLYSKSQLLFLTPPTPQFSVPCGRFLYFTKFGCQLEIQPYHPLSHILCVLTMRTHSPEGSTSVMLVSYQSQNSRLSSLWDPKHTSRPPRFSDIQPQTKCLCWFPLDPLELD